jgi:pimeloyl-ACP methyl ester carboxylesterase
MAAWSFRSQSLPGRGTPLPYGLRRVPVMAGTVENAASAIEESELVVDGVRVFYRRVAGEGTPVVYCHGNPTHGEDWLPFLERGGAAIAIDMPGWGRSEHPDPGRFDYSMYGLSAFLEKCLDELGVTKRKLVVHDWGGLALIGAQRRPELVEKLVVVNAVPLLPGYRWHWIAQLWRRKPIGEILNKTTTKGSLALLLRQASGDRRPMPADFVDLIWNHWDEGTQQATLALYRHADPARLAKAGSDLNELTCPALILWGDRDPYLPTKFADAYAASLPSSTLQVVTAAGHWPWIDDVRVIEDVLSFVE